MKKIPHNHDYGIREEEEFSEGLYKVKLYGEEVRKLVQEIRKEGYISDERYEVCENYINLHLNRITETFFHHFKECLLWCIEKDSSRVELVIQAFKNELASNIFHISFDLIQEEKKLEKKNKKFISREIWDFWKNVQLQLNSKSMTSSQIFSVMKESLSSSLQRDLTFFRNNLPKSHDLSLEDFNKIDDDFELSYLKGGEIFHQDFIPYDAIKEGVSDKVTYIQPSVFGYPEHMDFESDLEKAYNNYDESMINSIWQVNLDNLCREGTHLLQLRKLSVGTLARVTWYYDAQVKKYYVGGFYSHEVMRGKGLNSHLLNLVFQQTKEVPVYLLVIFNSWASIGFVESHKGVATEILSEYKGIDKKIIKVEWDPKKIYKSKDVSQEYLYGTSIELEDETFDSMNEKEDDFISYRVSELKQFRLIENMLKQGFVWTRFFRISFTEVILGFEKEI